MIALRLFISPELLGSIKICFKKISGARLLYCLHNISCVYMNFL